MTPDLQGHLLNPTALLHPHTRTEPQLAKPLSAILHASCFYEVWEKDYHPKFHMLRGFVFSFGACCKQTHLKATEDRGESARKGDPLVYNQSLHMATEVPSHLLSDTYQS